MNSSDTNRQMTPSAINNTNTRSRRRPVNSQTNRTGAEAVAAAAAAGAIDLPNSDTQTNATIQPRTTSNEANLDQLKQQVII